MLTVLVLSVLVLTLLVLIVSALTKTDRDQTDGIFLSENYPELLPWGTVLLRTPQLLFPRNSTFFFLFGCAMVYRACALG